MNSSLLLDTGFRESLRAQITLFKETNLATALSMGVAWEAMEAFLRGHIIQHTSFKKRQNMAKQIELEKQIQIAENNYKRKMSPINLTSLTLILFLLRKLSLPCLGLDRSSLKRGTKQEECW